ncbi:MAG TPA: CoA pyrophosphatase [Lentimicrobium sp.]|nr:CoA pyrophosphatase [Lentimicrobium sp.]
MEFNKFTASLTQALQLDLPGTYAQEMLSPSHRKDLLRQNPEMTGVRLSSVLLILFPGKDGEAMITFIRKKEYDGVHSRQVAFPGGKVEPEDKDLEETALREAEEEVGIKRDEIMVIGMLTDLYVPPSNYLIRPYVAVASEAPIYIPSSEEVDLIFSVPVSDFFSIYTASNYTIPYKNGLTIEVPGYFAGGHLIWGATAMILSELLEIAKKWH